MSAKSIVLVFLLPISCTLLPAQETQPGAPAQPTSSVYNRMRRVPPTAAAPQNQQARQTGQFPNPGQFPPEQHAATVPTQPGGQIPGSMPQGQAQPVQSQSGQPGQPPQVQVPQAPSGPALQPPNPPKISYVNGALTVIANNSALSDVLSAIERATGVRVEGTRPDAERVFGQFGPGSPRDVLNSLFSGSKYDFILTGSLDDPGGVQTIILSPHGTGAPSSGPVAAANQPVPRPTENDDDEAPAYQVPISEAPQPMVNNSEAGPQRGQQEQQQQQQQVKTPEQLLQELQRLRQQQRQQQGQQSPPTPTAPR